MTTKPETQPTEVDSKFINDALALFTKYADDTGGASPAKDYFIKSLREAGILFEPSIQERIDALHPSLREIMGDFGYKHLADGGLQRTSKILHNAMLELCEDLQNEDDADSVNPKTIAEMKAVANKIWEGKNLAVLMKVKR